MFKTNEITDTFVSTCLEEGLAVVAIDEGERTVWYLLPSANSFVVCEAYLRIEGYVCNLQQIPVGGKFDSEKIMGNQKRISVGYPKDIKFILYMQ